MECLPVQRRRLPAQVLVRRRLRGVLCITLGFNDLATLMVLGQPYSRVPVQAKSTRLVGTAYGRGQEPTNPMPRCHPQRGMGLFCALRHARSLARSCNSPQESPRLPTDPIPTEHSMIRWNKVCRALAWEVAPF